MNKSTELNIVSPLNTKFGSDGVPNQSSNPIETSKRSQENERPIPIIGGRGDCWIQVAYSMFPHMAPPHGEDIEPWPLTQMIEVCQFTVDILEQNDDLDKHYIAVDARDKMNLHIDHMGFIENGSLPTYFERDGEVRSWLIAYKWKEFLNLMHSIVEDFEKSEKPTSLLGKNSDSDEVPNQSSNASATPLTQPVVLRNQAWQFVKISQPIETSTYKIVEGKIFEIVGGALKTIRRPTLSVAQNIHPLVIPSNEVAIYKPRSFFVKEVVHKTSEPIIGGKGDCWCQFAYYATWPYRRGKKITLEEETEMLRKLDSGKIEPITVTELIGITKETIEHLRKKKTLTSYFVSVDDRNMKALHIDHMGKNVVTKRATYVRRNLGMTSEPMSSKEKSWLKKMNFEEFLNLLIEVEENWLKECKTIKAHYRTDSGICLEFDPFLESDKQNVEFSQPGIIKSHYGVISTIRIDCNFSKIPVVGVLGQYTDLQKAHDVLGPLIDDATLSSNSQYRSVMDNHDLRAFNNLISRQKTQIIKLPKTEQTVNLTNWKALNRAMLVETFNNFNSSSLAYYRILASFSAYHNVSPDKTEGTGEVLNLLSQQPFYEHKFTGCEVLVTFNPTVQNCHDYERVVSILPVVQGQRNLIYDCGEYEVRNGEMGYWANGSSVVHTLSSFATKLVMGSHVIGGVKVVASKNVGCFSIKVLSWKLSGPTQMLSRDDNVSVKLPILSSSFLSGLGLPHITMVEASINLSLLTDLLTKDLTMSMSAEDLYTYGVSLAWFKYMKKGSYVGTSLTEKEIRQHVLCCLIVNARRSLQYEFFKEVVSINTWKKLPVAIVHGMMKYYPGIDSSKLAQVLDALQGPHFKSSLDQIENDWTSLDVWLNRGRLIITPGAASSQHPCRHTPSEDEGTEICDCCNKRNTNSYLCAGCLPKIHNCNHKCITDTHEGNQTCQCCGLPCTGKCFDCDVKLEISDIETKTTRATDRKHTNKSSNLMFNYTMPSGKVVKAIKAIKPCVNKGEFKHEHECSICGTSYIHDHPYESDMHPQFVVDCPKCNKTADNDSSVVKKVSGLPTSKSNLASQAQDLDPKFTSWAALSNLVDPNEFHCLQSELNDFSLVTGGISITTSTITFVLGGNTVQQLDQFNVAAATDPEMHESCGLSCLKYYLGDIVNEHTIKKMIRKVDIANLTHEEIIKMCSVHELNCAMVIGDAVIFNRVNDTSEFACFMHSSADKSTELHWSVTNLERVKLHLEHNFPIYNAGSGSYERIAKITYGKLYKNLTLHQQLRVILELGNSLGKIMHTELHIPTYNNHKFSNCITANLPGMINKDIPKDLRDLFDSYSLSLGSLIDDKLTEKFEISDDNMFDLKIMRRFVIKECLLSLVNVLTNREKLTKISVTMTRSKEWLTFAQVGKLKTGDMVNTILNGVSTWLTVKVVNGVVYVPIKSTQFLPIKTNISITKVSVGSLIRKIITWLEVPIDAQTLKNLIHDAEAVQAPGGGGKTTSIKEFFKKNILWKDMTVLAVNSGAIQSAREKLHHSVNVMSFEAAGVEKVHTKVLVIDEASLIRPFELAAVLTDSVKQLFIFGDTTQIGVVDMMSSSGSRSTTSLLDYAQIHARSFEERWTTYRYGKTLVAQLKKIPKLKKLVSAAEHDTTFKISHLNTWDNQKIADIVNNEKPTKILFHYNATRTRLNKMEQGQFFNKLQSFDTIHPFQGKESSVVLVIQHVEGAGEIHLDQSYNISAATRAVNRLIWLTIGIFGFAPTLAKAISPLAGAITVNQFIEEVKPVGDFRTDFNSIMYTVPLGTKTSNQMDLMQGKIKSSLSSMSSNLSKLGDLLCLALDGKEPETKILENKFDSKLSKIMNEIEDLNGPVQFPNNSIASIVQSELSNSSQLSGVKILVLQTDTNFEVTFKKAFLNFWFNWNRDENYTSNLTNTQALKLARLITVVDKYASDDDYKDCLAVNFPEKKECAKVVNERTQSLIRVVSHLSKICDNLNQQLALESKTIIVHTGQGCSACCSLTAQLDDEILEFSSDYNVLGKRTYAHSGSNQKLLEKFAVTTGVELDLSDILTQATLVDYFSKLILSERISSFLKGSVGALLSDHKVMQSRCTENSKLGAEASQALGGNVKVDNFSRIENWPFRLGKKVWRLSGNNERVVQSYSLKRQSALKTKDLNNLLSLTFYQDMALFSRYRGYSILVHLFDKFVGATIPGMAMPVSWHESHNTSTFQRMVEHSAAMRGSVLKYSPKACHTTESVSQMLRNEYSIIASAPYPETILPANLIAAEMGFVYMLSEFGTGRYDCFGLFNFSSFCIEDSKIKMVSPDFTSKASSFNAISSDILRNYLDRAVERGWHLEECNFQLAGSGRWHISRSDIAQGGLLLAAMNMELIANVVKAYGSCLGIVSSQMVDVDSKRYMNFCDGELLLELTDNEDLMTHSCIMYGGDLYVLRCLRSFGIIKFVQIVKQSSNMMVRQVFDTMSKFQKVVIPTINLSLSTIVTKGELINMHEVLIHTGLFDSLCKRGLRKHTKWSDFLIQARVLYQSDYITVNTVSRKYEINMSILDNTAKAAIWHSYWEVERYKPAENALSGERGVKHSIQSLGKLGFLKMIGNVMDLFGLADKLKDNLDAVNNLIDVKNLDDMVRCLDNLTCLRLTRPRGVYNAMSLLKLGNSLITQPRDLPPRPDSNSASKIMVRFLGSVGDHVFAESIADKFRACGHAVDFYAPKDYLNRIPSIKMDVSCEDALNLWSDPSLDAYTRFCEQEGQFDRFSNYDLIVTNAYSGAVILYALFKNIKLRIVHVSNSFSAYEGSGLIEGQAVSWAMKSFGKIFKMAVDVKANIAGKMNSSKLWKSVNVTPFTLGAAHIYVEPSSFGIELTKSFDVYVNLKPNQIRQVSRILQAFDENGLEMCTSCSWDIPYCKNVGPVNIWASSDSIGSYFGHAGAGTLMTLSKLNMPVMLTADNPERSECMRKFIELYGGIEATSAEDCLLYLKTKRSKVRTKFSHPQDICDVLINDYDTHSFHSEETPNEFTIQLTDGHKILNDESVDPGCGVPINEWWIKREGFAECEVCKIYNFVINGKCVKHQSGPWIVSSRVQTTDKLFVKNALDSIVYCKCGRISTFRNVDGCCCGNVLTFNGEISDTAYYAPLCLNRDDQSDLRIANKSYKSSRTGIHLTIDSKGAVVDSSDELNDISNLHELMEKDESFKKSDRTENWCIHYSRKNYTFTTPMQVLAENDHWLVVTQSWVPGLMLWSKTCTKINSNVVSFNSYSSHINYRSTIGHDHRFLTKGNSFGSIKVLANSALKYVHIPHQLFSCLETIVIDDDSEPIVQFKERSKLPIRMTPRELDSGFEPFGGMTDAAKWLFDNSTGRGSDNLIEGVMESDTYKTTSTMNVGWYDFGWEVWIRPKVNGTIDKTFYTLKYSSIPHGAFPFLFSKRIPEIEMNEIKPGGIVRTLIKPASKRGETWMVGVTCTDIHSPFVGEIFLYDSIEPYHYWHNGHGTINSPLKLEDKPLYVLLFNTNQLVPCCDVGFGGLLMVLKKNAKFAVIGKVTETHSESWYNPKPKNWLVTGIRGKLHRVAKLAEDCFESGENEADINKIKLSMAHENGSDTCWPTQSDYTKLLEILSKTQNDVLRYLHTSDSESLQKEQDSQQDFDGIATTNTNESIDAPIPERYTNLRYFEICKEALIEPIDWVGDLDCRFKRSVNFTHEYHRFDADNVKVNISHLHEAIHCFIAASINNCSSSSCTLSCEESAYLLSTALGTSQGAILTTDKLYVLEGINLQLNGLETARELANALFSGTIIDYLLFQVNNGKLFAAELRNYTSLMRGSLEELTSITGKANRMKRMKLDNPYLLELINKKNTIVTSSTHPRGIVVEASFGSTLFSPVNPSNCTAECFDVWVKSKYPDNDVNALCRQLGWQQFVTNDTLLSFLCGCRINFVLKVGNVYRGMIFDDNHEVMGIEIIEDEHTSHAVLKTVDTLKVSELPPLSDVTIDLARPNKTSASVLTELKVIQQEDSSLTGMWFNREQILSRLTGRIDLIMQRNRGIIPLTITRSCSVFVLPENHSCVVGKVYLLQLVDRTSISLCCMDRKSNVVLVGDIGPCFGLIDIGVVGFSEIRREFFSNPKQLEHGFVNAESKKFAKSINYTGAIKVDATATTIHISMYDNRFHHTTDVRPHVDRRLPKNVTIFGGPNYNWGDLEVLRLHGPLFAIVVEGVIEKSQHNGFENLWTIAGCEGKEVGRSVDDNAHILTAMEWADSLMIPFNGTNYFKSDATRLVNETDKEFLKRLHRGGFATAANALELYNNLSLSNAQPGVLIDDFNFQDIVQLSTDKTMLIVGQNFFSYKFMKKIVIIVKGGQKHPKPPEPIEWFDLNEDYRLEVTKLNQNLKSTQVSTVLKDSVIDGLQSISGLTTEEVVSDSVELTMITKDRKWSAYIPNADNCNACGKYDVYVETPDPTTINYWDDATAYEDIVFELNKDTATRIRKPDVEFKSIDKAVLNRYPIYSRPIYTTRFMEVAIKAQSLYGGKIHIQKYRVDPKAENKRVRDWCYNVDWPTIVKKNMNNVLTFNTEDVISWLKDRPGNNQIAKDIVKMLEEDRSLHRLNKLNIHGKLESRMSDVLFVEGEASTAAPGTVSEQKTRLIVWQKKCLTALYSPIFIQAKQRFKELLRPEIIYADGLTPAELSNYLKRHAHTHEDVFGEDDLAKQDRQTNWDLLEAEMDFYVNDLGISESVIKMWKEAHRYWTARGTTIKLSQDAGRQTGQATTAIGNARVNLTIKSRLIKKLKSAFKFMLILGDDNLIVSEGVLTKRMISENSADYYNMVSKPFIDRRQGGFLRMIVYANNEGKYECGPDFIRMRRRFEVTNGVSEATPENMIARARSYVAAMGNMTLTEIFKEKHDWKVDLGCWYDLNCCMAALAIKYNCPTSVVESNLQSLINMIENPEFITVSKDMLSERKPLRVKPN